MSADPADVATTRVINHLGFPLSPEILALPGIEVIEVAPGEAPPSGIRGDVLYCPTSGGDQVATLLRAGVRWIQTFGTGIDAFPLELLTDEQVLTCARGAGAPTISEWVLAQMLAAVKCLPQAWISEAPERWNATPSRIGSLRGATVVIVGVGGIGTEVARLCLAFDMRVIGVRRHDRPAPLEGMEMAGDLATAAAEADHLVLAAPATADTHHLVDARVLDGVRPGLHLVNIARGALVDQDALRDALDDGRVALASLDVCDPEPLPPGHWLYSHERVHLSPHISWLGRGVLESYTTTFVENYHRFRSGRELIDVVDRDAGY